MKNYRFTLENGFYNQTKTSKIMRLTLSVIIALILQTVTNNAFSQSIEIYSDDFGTGIDNDTQADGDLNYYSTDNPGEGNYCIKWSAAAKYEAITLNFNPDKDMASLVDDGYALDMYVRGAVGTDPTYSFNIRFVDTKAGTDDHPWRILVTISNSVVEWDGEWHHLHIPLSVFEEQGSWDGAWYSPAGLFDWSAIDKFEIVGETQAMADNDVISFDNISITNETATAISEVESEFISLSYGANQQFLLKSENSSENSLYLIDMLGHVVLCDQFVDQYTINGAEFEKGIYILQVKNEKMQSYNVKISIH